MTELIEVQLKLSADRKEEILSEMLMYTREEKTLETEKAVRTSELNAKLKATRAARIERAEILENGYETRRIECLVLYDVPEKGMKRFIDPLSNEPVRDAEMTDEERRQERLNFE